MEAEPERRPMPSAGTAGGVTGDSLKDVTRTRGETPLGGNRLTLETCLLLCRTNLLKGSRWQDNI